MKKFATLVAIAALMFCNLAEAKTYNLGVSIYVGWLPWYYADTKGIVKEVAAAHGIDIQVVPMDYAPSLDAFVAGNVDACVMTNMEALDMPAKAGIDTTAVILGDYSNGNDAILVRDGLTFPKLKGQKIYLVELTVSHYLLARGLEMNGLTEKDVKVVNASDSDIAPVFISQPSEKVVVTWNPMVMQVAASPGVTKIFDSSKIPGEILDLCVVNTATLKAEPKLGDALVEIWYRVLKLMGKRGSEADAAMSQMAERSGANLQEFKGQLATTAMFWQPKDAVAYTSGKEIQAKMETVRQFCYGHGLLGEGAKSADVVGIQYPDGTIQGDAKNVKLRFDASYMQKAAEK